MNPVNTYFEQHVLSADPMDLVRMLYARATTLVRDAKRHLAAGDVAKRADAIAKAYDILLELIGSLNDEAAPDLCRNLRALYFYMQQRLLDANLNQVDAPLTEVLGLLTTMGEAWQGTTDQRPASTSAEPMSNPSHMLHEHHTYENHAVSRAYAA